MTCHCLFSTSIRRFVSLFILYIVTILIGGVIFIAIEEECEVINNGTKKTKGDIDYKRICEQIKGIIQPYLKDDFTRMPLIQNLSLLHKQCLSLRDLISKNNSSNKVLECTKWTLQNVIKWSAFSSSTIFTIGYGDPAPKTSTGMITMIIYALCGMPIALAMLGVGGQLMIDKLSGLVAFFEGRCLRTSKGSRDYVNILFAAFVSFLLSILGGCFITTNFHLHDRSWTVSIYYW